MLARPPARSGRLDHGSLDPRGVLLWKQRSTLPGRMVGRHDLLGHGALHRRLGASQRRPPNPRDGHPIRRRTAVSQRAIRPGRNRHRRILDLQLPFHTGREVRGLRPAPRRWPAYDQYLLQDPTAGRGDRRREIPVGAARRRHRRTCVRSDQRVGASSGRRPGRRLRPAREHHDQCLQRRARARSGDRQERRV